VGGADEHRLELALHLEVEAARQRAGVDRESFVQEERARPVFRGLTAMAADYAQLHGVLPLFSAWRIIGSRELIAWISA
jgi:hypothetical protein